MTFHDSTEKMTLYHSRHGDVAMIASVGDQFIVGHQDIVYGKSVSVGEYELEDRASLKSEQHNSKVFNIIS